MSELTIASWLAQSPEEVFRAFDDVYRLRRWYGAPPACHRTGGDLVLVPGESFRIELIDARGTPLAQIAQVVEQEPGRRLTIEMRWEGGELPQHPTRATIALAPADGGTRLEIRHASFADREQLEAQRAYWQANLAKLERVAAGEAVPCFEEFRDEAKGYVGPLGVAAYAVLAGLREAGAAADAIDEVERILESHLVRLSDETAAILGTVLRERLADRSS